MTDLTFQIWKPTPGGYALERQRLPSEAEASRVASESLNTEADDSFRLIVRHRGKKPGWMEILTA